MFRHRRKVKLLKTEVVPLYPTKVSNNSPDVATGQEKRTRRDLLHAFKKVSNVCSLRMVADTSTWRAGCSSKNSLIVETKRGMTDLS
jgi:hypothetical protein